MTREAGAVGGYLIPLAQERGWRVAGLAGAEVEEFVRGPVAEFTIHPDQVGTLPLTARVLEEHRLALVRDGGTFVGVRPAPSRPRSEGSR